MDECKVVKGLVAVTSERYIITVHTDAQSLDDRIRRHRHLSQ